MVKTRKILRRSMSGKILPFDVGEGPAPLDVGTKANRWAIFNRFFLNCAETFTPGECVMDRAQAVSALIRRQFLIFVFLAVSMALASAAHAQATIVLQQDLNG